MSEFLSPSKSEKIRKARRMKERTPEQIERDKLRTGIIKEIKNPVTVAELQFALGQIDKEEYLRRRDQAEKTKR